ncbi:MAG: tRNA (adenosine(37)-N6)-dimethylallyltransferase MiaA [Balneolaceae bacterium]
MKQRVIIAGPTASGKSSLSILLAEKTGGEIISVDSRQCYKKLDIGTAKPAEEELNRVPHHNISVLDLTDQDSVAAFRERAESYVKEIENHGKQVIFCGGSTLHLQSLIQPLDDIPSSDPQNIKQLRKKADREGLETLYQDLEKVDPEYAKKMDGLNRQRILRALDVWIQSGKPFSSFHSEGNIEKPSHYSVFALHHPRKILHRRISDRTDAMFEAGLIEETKKLLNEGYNPSLQALQTVGYKQVIQYLNSEISKSQMIEKTKTATRRYAKRQITWLRRWPFLKWIDMDEKTEKEAIRYIQHQVAADRQKG